VFSVHVITIIASPLYKHELFAYIVQKLMNKLM